MRHRLAPVVAALATLAVVAAEARPGRDRGEEDDNPAAPRSCLTSAARDLLARIEAEFGNMRVVSTCRPGATIAGTGRPSRHANGNAVDFDAGGRKAEILAWLIANHHDGGIMTYPAMDHVHVDIGSRFVSITGRDGPAVEAARLAAADRPAQPARADVTMRRQASAVRFLVWD